jgi:hypothetical protein
MRGWMLMEMRSRHEKRDEERAGVADVTDYKLSKSYTVSAVYTPFAG